jgi:chaperonin GroES
LVTELRCAIDKKYFNFVYLAIKVEQCQSKLYENMNKGGSKMIRPLGEKILVKPTEVKEVKKGGIIIPDTAKEKPQEGEVIAVGVGKKTDDGKVLPLDVKKGDKVLFGKYSGTEVKINDVEHLIMSQDDILGIIVE